MTFYRNHNWVLVFRFVQKTSIDFSLLGQFLPTDLVLHFEIVAIKELADLSIRKDCFYIYLD